MIEKNIGDQYSNVASKVMQNGGLAAPAFVLLEENFPTGQNLRETLCLESHAI